MVRPVHLVMAGCSGASWKLKPGCAATWITKLPACLPTGFGEVPNQKQTAFKGVSEFFQMAAMRSPAFSGLKKLFVAATVLLQ